MNILHVHDFFAPGNSRYGFDMNRMLVKRGHKVHVLAGTGPLGPGNDTKVEGVLFHTYPYAFEKGGLGKYRYAMAQNAERFNKLHELYKFELLILNQPLCSKGILQSPAAAALPKIYSFISPWAEEWRIANPKAGFLKKSLNYKPRLKMEREALNAADQVIVESMFIENELKRLHPDVPQSKVTMIPGAVDLERFQPPGTQEACRDKLGLPQGCTIIYTLRRLVPRMGIENLMWALRRMPETYFVIGGDGPLRQELEELADELDMEHRVKFLGYVKDEDMTTLYRAADLFVLPTKALEGFGLVLIESMACGTPSAGTPIGAIPEVIGDLDRRLVLPGTEPEQIRSGLARILEDEAFLNSMKEKCRDYVSSRFNWVKIVESFEEVIRLARDR